MRQSISKFLTHPKAGQFIPALFFLFYFLLGLGLFDDYGMSWDEELQRRHGIVSADFINEKYKLVDKDIAWEELDTYPFRYHGVLFSMTAYVLETYQNLESYRHKFMLRHKMVFMLFWLGSLFFFFIARISFGHWQKALLATTLLLLSPRIFADSFFNPKDLVFLPLFLINCFTLLQLLRNKKIPISLLLTILHALATGMLISTRIIGIIIPAMTLFFFLLALINERFKLKTIAKYLLCTPLYLGLILVFTYMLWPYLWEAPQERFLEVFELMSEFTWEGKVYFYGEWIKGLDLPWYYLPNWMLITIPPIYLLFFFIGAVLISVQWIQTLIKGQLYISDHQLVNLMASALFLGPLLAVIIRKSVVYDGWRHLYFVYPFLILIALTGFQWLWEKRKDSNKYNQLIAKGAAFLLTAGMVHMTIFMLINHPHQNVYFNFLAGKNIETRFDTDYWGISYKQAFEKLHELEPEMDSIRVAYSSYPAELNHQYLRFHIQKRFILKEKAEEADYFISNFRHGPWGMEQYKKGAFPYVNEVYARHVGNAKVFAIYKLPPPAKE